MQVHDCHGGAAGRRIDVANPSRAVARTRCRAQRLHDLRVRIAKDRRVWGCECNIGRHVGNRIRRIRQCRRHFTHGAGFECGSAEPQVQGHVERVEPDHRPAAVVRMLVPRPCGGENEIAEPHRARFAVDDGEGAFALEHKADGVHGVAMRAGGFPGQQDLQRCGEGTRGRLILWAARDRIDQCQHAAFDRGGVRHLDRAPDQRTHALPRPQIGWVGWGRGLVRGRAFPKRREVSVFPRLAQLIGRVQSGH